MDHEKSVYDHDADQLSGSDIPNDAGGVDAGDMYRMGKEQQFRVSFTHMPLVMRIKLTFEAYFPCLNNDVLYINGPINMGSCVDVRMSFEILII